jgi:2-polyprenyl-3-methyl-5-hydroxy-6-metoxy-1,4-benzoquinol methylase
MGAKVTAVNLSNVAIDIAKQLALECGEEVEFICSDIYELPQNLIWFSLVMKL